MESEEELELEMHQFDSDEEGSQETLAEQNSGGNNAGNEVVNDFFNNRTYTSKKDIVAAVIAYSKIYNRAHRVVCSDCRRYMVLCKKENCAFLVVFAFSSEYGPPTKFVDHDCCLTEHDAKSHASKRHLMGKQLADNPIVRDLFLSEARKVTPIIIKNVVEAAGLPASYKNCLNAHKRLWNEFFGDDLLQFSQLPSYVGLLQERSHATSLAMVGDRFDKLCIIYREGAKAFSSYTDCGLQVDGTSFKTSVGGIILITCFRHGDKKN